MIYAARTLGLKMVCKASYPKKLLVNNMMDNVDAVLPIVVEDGLDCS